MPFPVTARYFLNFRNSDTGLTPTSLSWKNANTFANISPPTFTEHPSGGGAYYFDWTWTTKNDPDIVFEIDGGASIPTEEVRYIKGALSPRDRFLDEPISQVVTDVWADSTAYSAGQKGKRVDQLGDPTDLSSASTMFGKELLYTERIRGDSAGLTDGENVKLARDRVMGGTGFGGTGVDVKTVKDTIGVPATDTAASVTVIGKTLLARDEIMGGTGFGGTGVDVKTVNDNLASDTSTITTAISTSTATTATNISTGTSTTATNITNAVTSVKGTDAWSITDIAGTGFTSGADSLVAVQASVAAVKGVVDTINVETDPASIAGAVWDEAAASHVIAGSFGQALQNEDSGLVQGGASTTVTLRAGASAVTDFYKNGLVEVTSGTGAKQARSITAYNGTTKIATVDRAWGTTPVSGDGYVVHPAAPSSSLTNAGIAAAVWDEAIAGHTSAGSTGEKLNAPAVDNAAIAGAVWDVGLSGHLASGTTGEKLNSGGAPYVRFYSNGDTVAPIVIQVTSPKHTQVRVTFSEAVVMDNSPIGALNTANYTIPGLTVVGAQSLTAQQVLLTTSAQTPNFLYTLTVTNVQDLQGNPIG